MKRSSAILILVLILLGCSRHAGPTLPVEALSARMGPQVVLEVNEPPVRLLEVTARLAPRGKYSSQDFLLTLERGSWKGKPVPPNALVVEGRYLEVPWWKVPGPN
jgi:hypothetical protein